MRTVTTIAKRALGFLQRASGVQRKAGVAVRDQVSDFRFFHRVIGISPMEFHRYRLWDRSQPIEARLAFLSHTEQRKIEFAINPSLAVAALNDKAAAALRLAEAGIRVPRTLGHLEISPLGASEPQLAHVAASLQLLLEHAPPTGVVLKPNRGQGGYRVLVYRHATSTHLTSLDGSVVSVAEVAEQLLQSSTGRWNVESRLLTHASLLRFAPLAVPSMRVLSFRSPTGELLLGPASLKLPLGTSGVDNFGSGNLASSVDLVTGRVGGAVTLDGEGQLVVHPTTGEPLATLQLPELTEALALVRAAANELAELPLLGWDVAFSSDGPVILEGNAWAGVDILQMPRDAGLVQGRFAELLELHGLGELIGRRERAAAEWRRNHSK